MTKKDGSFHHCDDYRRLNTRMEPDSCLLPHISDINSLLQGANISKLDLLKSYYLVPMHSVDIPKTAITIPFGTFTFNDSCNGQLK